MNDIDFKRDQLFKKLLDNKGKEGQTLYLKFLKKEKSVGVNLMNMDIFDSIQPYINLKCKTAQCIYDFYDIILIFNRQKDPKYFFKCKFCNSKINLSDFILEKQLAQEFQSLSRRFNSRALKCQLVDITLVEVDQKQKFIYEVRNLKEVLEYGNLQEIVPNFLHYEENYYKLLKKNYVNTSHNQSDLIIMLYRFNRYLTKYDIDEFVFTQLTQSKNDFYEISLDLQWFLIEYLQKWYYLTQKKPNFAIFGVEYESENKTFIFLQNMDINKNYKENKIKFYPFYIMIVYFRERFSFVVYENGTDQVTLVGGIRGKEKHYRNCIKLVFSQILNEHHSKICLDQNYTILHKYMTPQDQHPLKNKVMLLTNLAKILKHDNLDPLIEQQENFNLKKEMKILRGLKFAILGMWKKFQEDTGKQLWTKKDFSAKNAYQQNFEYAKNFSYPQIQANFTSDRQLVNKNFQVIGDKTEEEDIKDKFDILAQQLLENQEEKQNQILDLRKQEYQILMNNIKLNKSLQDQDFSMGRSKSQAKLQSEMYEKVENKGQVKGDKIIINKEQMHNILQNYENDLKLQKNKEKLQKKDLLNSKYEKSKFSQSQALSQSDKSEIIDMFHLKNQKYETLDEQNMKELEKILEFLEHNHYELYLDMKKVYDQKKAQYSQENQNKAQNNEQFVKFMEPIQEKNKFINQKVIEQNQFKVRRYGVQVSLKDFNRLQYQGYLSGDILNFYIIYFLENQFLQLDIELIKLRGYKPNQKLFVMPTQFADKIFDNSKEIIDYNIANNIIISYVKRYIKYMPQEFQAYYFKHNKDINLKEENVADVRCNILHFNDQEKQIFQYFLIPVIFKKNDSSILVFVDFKSKNIFIFDNAQIIYNEDEDDEAVVNNNPIFRKIFGYFNWLLRKNDKEGLDYSEWNCKFIKLQNNDVRGPQMQNLVNLFFIYQIYSQINKFKVNYQIIEDFKQECIKIIELL